MGAWGIKALERDEGLDVLDILKNEYVPEHPVMDLGEMIELMKEEVMLGSDFSQIDFLFHQFDISPRSITGCSGTYSFLRMSSTSNPS